MRPGPIEWSLGVAGVGLVVAAVLNRNPIAAALEAATGGDASTAPAIDTGTDRMRAEVVTGAGGGTGANTTGADSTGDAPGGMVTWTDAAGKSFPMTAATRDGIVRWNQLHKARFGKGLQLTSAYRSPQLQAQQHASDPDRFASAESSWHVKGKAVDVHMAASGVNTDAEVAEYIRIGEAAGWCFRGKSGKMHASYGGCG